MVPSLQLIRGSVSCQPCGPDQAGEQSSLLGVGELHDPRSLDFLPDPLTLAHIVDEHELDPDVATVGRLRRRKTSGRVSETPQTPMAEPHVHTKEHKQNTSSLRMISRRGRVVSPPPMKEVGGSWKLRSKSDSSRP